MCCIRLDSRELVGNLLGCEALKAHQWLDMETVDEYCRNIREVLPGYVFFENSPSEIRSGVRYWDAFANWNDESQTFCLKTERQPNLERVNAIYPEYLSKTIEGYTHYFLSNRLLKSVASPTKPPMSTRAAVKEMLMAYVAAL